MNNIEKKRIVRYFIISKMLHLRYNDTTQAKEKERYKDERTVC